MLKQLIKSALRRTPYRIVQTGGSNRFQANDEVLASLASRGYRPKVFIDGGANVGDYSRMCQMVFGPALQCHLVEPQPACYPQLERLTGSGGITLHRCALGRSKTFLRLAIDAAGVTTGSHIVVDDHHTGQSVDVPVDTLDNLFVPIIKREHRALMKLDLQGWEMEALAGGNEALKNIEAVLIEVSFYAQAYEPPVSDVILFMKEHGFALHDIASLSARRRDNRAHQADLLFVAAWSALSNDNAWS